MVPIVGKVMHDTLSGVKSPEKSYPGKVTRVKILGKAYQGKVPWKNLSGVNIIVKAYPGLGYQ